MRKSQSVVAEVSLVTAVDAGEWWLVWAATQKRKG